MPNIVTTIDVTPARSIDQIVNDSRFATEITTLHVAPDSDSTVLVYASNGVGVQKVYSAANLDRWPAWLKGFESPRVSEGTSASTVREDRCSEAREIRRAASPASPPPSPGEVTAEQALDRARRMASQYPRARAAVIGDYLVHGERVGRVLDGLIRPWIPEGLR
ncbi:hypothetical protein SMICM304S_11449 [Streptomyces microflavus]